MEKRPYRRRRYFINAGLQLRYMAVIIFCMLNAALIVGYFTYLGIWNAVIPEFSDTKLVERLKMIQGTRDFELGRSRSPEDDAALSLFTQARLLSAHEREVVSQVLKEANVKLIPKLIAVVIFLSIGSIFISHEIAGPIYKFEKSAMAIAGGDLTVKFKLRKGDELKDLADALEKMATSLKRKVNASLEAARQLSDGLEKLSQKAGDTADKRLLSDAKESLSKIEAELSTFKTEV